MSLGSSPEGEASLFILAKAHSVLIGVHMLRLRHSLAATAVFAFASCAAQQEPIRTCSMNEWDNASRRLKSINMGLYDEDPITRLRSAREFSKTVGLIGCTESLLRNEMQRIDLAKYAILDASIGMLADKDLDVRIASCNLISHLVLDMRIRMDSISFRALSAGLQDVSPEIRKQVAKILVFVCAREPNLCHDLKKKTSESLALEYPISQE